MNDICGYCLDKEATMKRFFDICNFYDIKNKDLVKLFNVSNVIVSYWRNGSRFPGWDKLMVFAYTVGLPLEVMIIGKEKIENNQMDLTKKRIEINGYIDSIKNVLLFLKNNTYSVFNGEIILTDSSKQEEYYELVSKTKRIYEEKR